MRSWPEYCSQSPPAPLWEGITQPISNAAAPWNVSFDRNIPARPHVREFLEQFVRPIVGGGEVHIRAPIPMPDLERWESEWRAFWRIAPRTDVAQIEDEHEGTATAQA